MKLKNKEKDALITHGLHTLESGRRSIYSAVQLGVIFCLLSLVCSSPSDPAIGKQKDKKGPITQQAAKRVQGLGLIGLVGFMAYRVYRVYGACRVYRVYGAYRVYRVYRV